MTREHLRPLVERMNVSHCWRKTKDGPRRIAEPFDALKLSEHIAGVSAYGLCPIAPGSSVTQVACLDLDSHKGEMPWPGMLAASSKICKALEADLYEPHRFKSSGGSGVHIYLMWDEPQDAYSVREMLRAVLEQCGMKPGTGGVANREVEIFPKQNEVAHDGFGSMFILPFAGHSAPIGDFTGWQASAPVPVLSQPPRPERVAVDLPELGRIRGALDAIPNAGNQELDYDQWRNIIFAIHHATEGSDEGLAIAHEFSARSSKYEPEFLDSRVWEYVSSDRAGAVITERTLFATAAEHGWQDPAIADEFECLEVAETEPLVREVAMFTAVRAADFAAGRPLEWIIKDVLPHADVGMLFGASGSGKSFFVIDMAGSIVRGLEWRGKRVKQGRVCYVAAEGAPGLKKRIDAYCMHNEIAIADLDLYIIADAPNLTDKAHVTALIKSLKAAGPFDLVVLDTLAAVSEGADENSAQDMGKVLARARAIGKSIGAMVLIVHHSGKDTTRGARGSTALKGRVDVEIEIARFEQDRVALVSKLRDQEDSAEFGFKLLTITVGMDDAGEVISSCVVQHAAAVSKSQRKALSKPKGDNERLVWQAVMDLQGLDGTAPTTNEVLDEALSHIVKDPDAKRDRRREVVIRALNGLREAGRVVINGDRIALPGSERE